MTIASTEAPIIVRDEGAVRLILLNRPHARNALTRAMRQEFAQHLAQADADAQISAVVLSGTGGCFSAGVDLKDRIAGAAPIKPNPAQALRSLNKPVIAAIDGYCITGALEMALSCDFAIATPTAQFADTHCRVGLFPRWGGGHLLSSAIGVRRARQMMLAGQMINATTALAWGLINEIQPQYELLPRACALASAMAQQAAAQPLAYHAHKTMLDAIAAGADPVASEAKMLHHFDHNLALLKGERS